MNFSHPIQAKNTSENIDNGFESQRDFDSNTLKYSNFSQENKLSTFLDANNMDSGERYEDNDKLNYDIKNEEEFENLQYESENYKVYVNNEDYSHEFNLNQDYDNNTFSNKKEINFEHKNEKFPSQEKEEKKIEKYADLNYEKPPIHRPPPPRNQEKDANITNVINLSDKQKKIEKIPPEANFDKLKNSKLFQKFLKEENINRESKSIISENKKLIEAEKPSGLPQQYQNNYFPKERNRNLEEDKELAGFSQIVPGNMYISPNQLMSGFNTYGQIDPNLMNYNSNIYDFANMTEEQIFNKKKVVELTDLLSKEIEKTQLLERKCLDYMSHIDRLTKNYEEIKYRLLENEDYKQKIYECENCSQRIENMENYLTEVETLKKKLNQEVIAKNKLDEEVKDLNRYIIQLQESITEKESQNERNNEENIEIRKNLETLKTDNFTNKSAKFKLEEKIKEFENEIINITNDYNFEKKQVYELKERVKSLESEKEKLKNENINLKNTMNNNLIENESLKNENYNMKQDLQEKSQKEMQFALIIEKANMETNQFKVLLSRTEKNLADQKDQNQNLIKKLSDIAKDNSVRIYSKNLTPVKNSFNYDNTYNDSERKSFQPKDDPEREHEYKRWKPLTKEINEQYNYQNIYPNNHHLIKNQNTNKSGFNNNNDSDSKYDRPINNNNNNNFNDYDLTRNNANNTAYLRNEYVNNHPTKHANKNSVSANFLEWNEPPPKKKDEKSSNDPLIVNKKKNEMSMNNLKNEKLFQEYSPKKTEIIPPKPRDFGDKPIYYDQRLKDKPLPPRKNDPNSSSLQRDIPKKEEENKIFGKEGSNKKRQAENENILHTIKTVEKNLMLAQIQKEKMEADLRKIEEARTKTAANIRKKGEIEEEMKILASNITQLKTKLREMNALHSY